MSLWNSTQSWKTYQVPQKYEAAISRHAQAVRWMQSKICPRLQAITAQHDPTCPLCAGRGRIYQLASTLMIYFEPAQQIGPGMVKPQYTPWQGTPTVFHQGVTIPISETQPADQDYIAFDPPYPQLWNALYINYEFSPLVTVTNENSTVVGTNVLQTLGTQASMSGPLLTPGENNMSALAGQTYSGTIDSVTSVYNVTRSETYTVATTSLDFIYLTGMGSWQSGDTLQVTYSYVPPYRFVISAISPKMRWESPYLQEGSDAVLITPGFVRVSSGDLFTPLTAIQIDSQVIDPRVSSGPMDAIKNYFDIKQLLSITQYDGTLASPSNYQLFGRNQVNWLSSRPTLPYSVQFTFNPTFVALPSLPTMRFAENKTFANRVNLVFYNRASDQENFG